MRKSTLFFLLLLTACGGEEHQDLRQWMNDVSKDMRGKIPPLPSVKPYEPAIYSVTDLTDPFKISKIDPITAAKESKGSGIKPPIDRRKEPLEAFPLESLKMVGTLAQHSVNYALIEADKSIYRVKIGNHMGQNFGIITNISESEVVLKEIVQDPGGDWVERTSTLQLQEPEAKR